MRKTCLKPGYFFGQFLAANLAVPSFVSFCCLHCAIVKILRVVDSNICNHNIKPCTTHSWRGIFKRIQGCTRAWSVNSGPDMFVFCAVLPVKYNLFFSNIQ